MKAIRSINRYFLADDDEAIHWTDLTWFYGGYGVVFLMVTVVALS